jgi:hypothetical protein
LYVGRASTIGRADGGILGRVAVGFTDVFFLNDVLPGNDPIVFQVAEDRFLRQGNSPQALTSTSGIAAALT